MKIKNQIIEIIKVDKKGNIKPALMTLFNRKEKIINDYLKKNHILLTTVDALNLIAQYVNIPVQELIEEGKPYMPRK